MDIEHHPAVPLKEWIPVALLGGFLAVLIPSVLFGWSDWTVIYAAYAMGIGCIVWAGQALARLTHFTVGEKVAGSPAGYWWWPGWPGR